MWPFRKHEEPVKQRPKKTQTLKIVCEVVELEVDTRVVRVTFDDDSTFHCIFRGFWSQNGVMYGNDETPFRPMVEPTVRPPYITSASHMAQTFLRSLSSESRAYFNDEGDITKAVTGRAVSAELLSERGVATERFYKAMVVPKETK